MPNNNSLSIRARLCAFLRTHKAFLFGFSSFCRHSIRRNARHHQHQPAPFGVCMCVYTTNFGFENKWEPERRQAEELRESVCGSKAYALDIL